MAEVELPLDSHGFLRRQCPHCQREFKWHHGPVGELPNDAPEVNEYHCPYCGGAADFDQWWTEEQVDMFRAEAFAEAGPVIEESLRSALEGVNSSGIITASVELERQVPPPPLDERDDMVAVASPCHGYEPVKVLESWTGDLHCLVCGSTFNVLR